MMLSRVAECDCDGQNGRQIGGRVVVAAGWYVPLTRQYGQSGGQDGGRMAGGVAGRASAERKAEQLAEQWEGVR
jgi:hypothetical protein